MPESATAHRAIASENGAARPRVLIIDDESAIRESLELLLEMEGFSVTTAPDGEQGLTTLESATFDLVLLDLAGKDIEIEHVGGEHVQELRVVGNDDAG